MPTKKTVKKKPQSKISALSRKITSDNKRFTKLSKAEQRVIIAKDVLMRLEAHRISPEWGVYIEPKNPDAMSSGAIPTGGASGDTQVDQVLKKNLNKCNACALGSLFVCAVDRADKLKLKELSPDIYRGVKKSDEDEGYGLPDELYIYRENIAPYLSRFFSNAQLNMIEDAFENYAAGYALGGDPVGYAEKLDRPRSRMKAIMNNIIRNNGTFRPKKDDAQGKPID